MNHRSKITAKGQTTIPVEVRDALNLKPGDQIRYVIDESGVHLMRKNRHISELAGLLGNPPHGAGASIEDMDKAIGEYLAEDDERIRREWHEGRP
ncbi:MAG: type II toxin-antitoxin system PrlF family antitoxin [Hyphomicrobiales bacterium]|nr:type II toxin-antitoxin system PrlF family antitoxin [Hyphomicrobiales bacterium]